VAVFGDARARASTGSGARARARSSDDATARARTRACVLGGGWVVHAHVDDVLSHDSRYMGMGRSECLDRVCIQCVCVYSVCTVYSVCVCVCVCV
jgi:hypothetical protein